MQKTFGKTWPLVAAVVLIAVYLRAPITGIGSLVNEISSELGLSASAAGMLTTIPLLAFAVISLFTGAFAHKVGAGYAMLTGLAVALAGILCRSFLGTGGLFAGTVVIGCGIAVGNVLLPALIKKFFPGKIWLMTSVYTTVMTGMGGVSAAVGIPLSRLWGWRGALAIWAVFCAIALIWWLPYRKVRLENADVESRVRQRSAREIGTSDKVSGRRANAEEPRRTVTPAESANEPAPENIAAATAGISVHQMARHRSAWLVALYMGMQSLLFYCFVAWFSPVLQANGTDAATAGLLNSVYLFIGVPGSLAVPWLARRVPNQAVLGGALGVIYLAGMIAFLFPQNIFALATTMICCGFCQGACISFAMAQFGVHTATPHDASSLSSFGQSVGYLVAAVGPVLLGTLVDATGSWSCSHIVLIVGALVVALLGHLVGKPYVIGQKG